MSAAPRQPTGHAQCGRPAMTRPPLATLPLLRLLLAALVALLMLAGCSRGATPTPTTLPVPGTPNIPPLPNGDERKIDPILLDILRVYRESGQAAAEQLARDSGLLTSDNIVRLTLVL